MVDNLKQYILENFKYENGRITRTDRKGGLGSKDKDGYLILKVKGKRLKAHRVAWLLNYGEFPEGEIDHINRDRTDNRIENLRIASRTLQCNNIALKPNAVTKAVGIHFDTTKGLKKNYTFSHKKKTYRYYTLQEAVEARTRIKEAYFLEIGLKGEQNAVGKH